MNEANNRFTVEHYENQLKQYGYSPKTLGWNNGRHNLRYYILLSQWKFNNNTLLDFGCGFGDMYGFCVRNGYHVIYEGVDLSPKLIKMGKSIYPDAHLWSGDVLHDGLSKQYDFILSSGVHNLKIDDTWGFIQATFDFFNKHSTLGFALNFLSNKVEYMLDHAYHADPAQILNLAYQYSNRVVLRNDYIPFEFTVFVDKRKAFDRELVVYPEYLEYAK
jgi:SAM-dependent methyltransferase